MFNKLFLWISVVPVALCFGTPSLFSASKKPNIILVMTDDQGYGSIGRHGNTWMKTPHLDNFYDESTRFTRFYVSPTCAPTRAAILTGRHPFKNGVTHTILERERMALSGVTIPQVLKNAGYRSGIFGKWHLGDEAEYQPEKRGFDEVFIHGGGGIGQSFASSCADAPRNRYFNPAIRHNGKFVKTKGYCTDLFFDAALTWIKKEKDKDEPFFAFISTNAPHGPFIAPPKYAERFKALGFGGREAGFYGMIENIDDNMGKLLAKCKDWSLLENTVIIFMVDNGMTNNGSGRGLKQLGQTKDGKAITRYNAGMKNFKGSVDEGGVRVPFFIRWDGQWKAGRNIDRLSGHIDILPTFAAIAGVDYPTKQVEGRSLLPLLKGEQKDWNDRYMFFHVGRWGKGKEPNDYRFNKYAVRNQTYTLVGRALYNIEKDPGQKVNIAEKNPELVQAMREAFGRFWEEARPLMVNETVPNSKIRPYHVWYYTQEKKEGIPDWRPNY